MSANLDASLGFIALAFTGSRSKIWHGTGQSIDDKAKEIGRPLTVDEIMALGGLNFSVEKVPMLVSLAGSKYDHIAPAKRLLPYPDRFANTRTDTGAPLGIVSDQYQLVQPAQIGRWFEQLLETDSRFKLSTVGALDGGRRIWGQAEFSGVQSVGGDDHTAKLLMSTTFDATGSTVLKGSMTRVVCENTIEAAMSEHSPAINVRHAAKFDAEKARAQLAKVAGSFVRFKAMGDALAQVTLTKPEIATFIRDVLNIPHDVDYKDLPTRTKNRQNAVVQAMLVSANERAKSLSNGADAFTALQAITRYVDHDRDADDTESRLFGSGAALKNKALGLLMPRIADRIAA
jgi:phage/plasmid-like protein (TIGR03299 family)